MNLYESIKKNLKESGYADIDYRGDDYWELNDLYDDGAINETDLAEALLRLFKTRSGAVKAFKEITDDKDFPIKGNIKESTSLLESSYETETDPEQRLKNVYLMDRVIRSMNNEDPLYESPWLYYVEDEATDGGFEKFKEDSRDWDWANSVPKDTYNECYVGDEDYQNIVNIYKRLVNDPEYNQDGFITKEYYKGREGNWKELAGLDEEGIAFLKQDIPNPVLINN